MYDLSLVFRQWGSHLDLHNSHLLAIAAAEHRLLQAEYEDYTDANSSGIACLCSIAVITVSKQTQFKSYYHLFCVSKLIYVSLHVQLLIVLVIRQTLMIARFAGLLQGSSTFNVCLKSVLVSRFAC